MNNFHVSDALWERIKPLIPKHVNNHPRGDGRKRIADRIVFNAILITAHTGCQWKALDAIGTCSGSTTLPFHEPDCVSPAYPVCFTNYGKRICSNTIKRSSFGSGKRSMGR